MKRFVLLCCILTVLLSVPASAAGSAPAPEPTPAQLPDLLVELFGAYEPRTYTVTETLPDGTVVVTEQYVPGLAGLDHPWIAAVALFALVIFCVFKLIGGVFKL